MKTLEKDKLKTLLQIIRKNPSLRIAHFSEGGEMMTEILSDFCLQNNYEYQINCTQTSFFDMLMDKYANVTNILPVKFTLNRPRYKIQGKEYEYLFVTSTISKEQRSEFIKKCYQIIKNAGNIIIFLPKDSYEERYDWVALLEEHYYVATNTIDDLFEHYDVVISKRMHGWGNK